jgi:hypothetical protein
MEKDEICKPCVKEKRKVKTCLNENCNIQPSFNFENEKKGIYCKTHSKEEMIDVKNKHKICKEDNCKILSSFNFKNEKKGVYCKQHAKDEMIDVITKRCEEIDCDIYPSYNFNDQKVAIYCKAHKKENMIAVLNKNKFCIENNCFIRGQYNYESENKGVYCKEHAKDEMVDVMNRKKFCIENYCSIRGHYNYESEKSGIYCQEHAKENMVDVVNRIKSCIENNCSIRGQYNFEKEKRGIYCRQHKKEGMIDIVNKRCKTEYCNIRANRKYNGYCLFCFIHLFPDQPNARNYKTKEKAVSEYILEQFPNFTWKTDKKIEDGCSKRRPDLFLDLGYQIIIIEIDENEHQNYEQICENKRTMELSKDLNHRPIVFIRFNPDNYTLNNTKVSSCWSPNKDGILSVKKSKLNEWNERLKKLKETVLFWINTISEKTVEVNYLFFSLN